MLKTVISKVEGSDVIRNEVGKIVDSLWFGKYWFDREVIAVFDDGGVEVTVGMVMFNGY